jgi:hypothetical protein
MSCLDQAKKGRRKHFGNWAMLRPFRIRRETQIVEEMGILSVQAAYQALCATPPLSASARVLHAASTSRDVLAEWNSIVKLGLRDSFPSYQKLGGWGTAWFSPVPHYSSGSRMWSRVSGLLRSTSSCLRSALSAPPEQRFLRSFAACHLDIIATSCRIEFVRNPSPS